LNFEPKADNSGRKGDKAKMSKQKAAALLHYLKRRKTRRRLFGNRFGRFRDFTHG
jgi:hypothetical protein